MSVAKILCEYRALNRFVTTIYSVYKKIITNVLSTVACREVRERKKRLNRRKKTDYDVEKRKKGIYVDRRTVTNMR